MKSKNKKSPIFKALCALFLALLPLFTLAESTIKMSQSDSSMVDLYILKSKQARSSYDLIRADLFLDTALELAWETGDKRDIAKISLSKGNVKKSLNDKGSALDLIINAINLFEQLEDWHFLTVAYIDLAEFYRSQRKYEDAVEYITKAKVNYSDKQMNDLNLLCKIYNRSAAINNEFNPEPYASIKDSKMALNLAKKIPDSSLIAVSFNELGFTYKNLLKVDSSEYFYKEAERLWMQEGKYQEALHAKANRAQLYQHNNYKLDQVIPLYKRIVYLSDSLQLTYSLMKVSFELYNIYLSRNDTVSAYRYLKMHHDETISLYNAQTSNEMYNVNARYKNDKIQRQYEQVSQELTESSKSLKKQKEQQVFLISFLALLFLLFILIIYLFFRLRVSNKKLAIKNSEKDSLIQEIHHRVKNNLQFISSLINMQVKVSESENESLSLHETSRRINAMALVHEMLYNKADQQGISAKYYLEELIDSLYALVNSDSLKIDFEMDIMDIDLNVSDTISIGMITSELISNSMKHAFKEVDAPKVRILLKRLADNTFNYTISDNGAGFSADLKEGNSLGLRLVDIFSRQLKGTYEISGTDGFRYTLNFKSK